MKQKARGKPERQQRARWKVEDESENAVKVTELPISDLCLDTQVTGSYF